MERIRSNVHFRRFEHSTQLPDQCEHFRGALKLPRVTADKGETFTNDERFEHSTRPTQVTRGNLDHKVGGFVNLFASFRSEESGDHEHMEGVLAFDASFS
jgi:hypothetical protein